MTESITDTNEIEFCQKQVWIVYLNRILQGDALTTVDSNLLDSIAHLNAIVFGSGVRMARLLLNLELYDELESGSRMASQIRKAELPFDIKLVPNPASWSLRVIPSIQYTDAMITIQDLSGRIIYQRPNAHEVDLSLFSSGSYLLKYTAETNTVTKLFVIQK